MAGAKLGRGLAWLGAGEDDIDRAQALTHLRQPADRPTLAVVGGIVALHASRSIREAYGDQCERRRYWRAMSVRGEIGIPGWAPRCP